MAAHACDGEAQHRVLVGGSHTKQHSTHKQLAPAATVVNAEICAEEQMVY